MKTYCFGMNSVIKVQRKNPVGFPLFVPLTHFAGLNNIYRSSEQDAASQTLCSYERIIPSDFRSYQQLFSNPQQLGLIKVSRHSVVFCKQPFCNTGMNPWLPLLSCRAMTRSPCQLI